MGWVGVDVGGFGCGWVSVWVGVGVGGVVWWQLMLQMQYGAWCINNPGVEVACMHPLTQHNRVVCLVPGLEVAVPGRGCTPGLNGSLELRTRVLLKRLRNFQGSLYGDDGEAPGRLQLAQEVTDAVKKFLASPEMMDVRNKEFLDYMNDYYIGDVRHIVDDALGLASDYRVPQYPPVKWCSVRMRICVCCVPWLHGFCCTVVN